MIRFLNRVINILVVVILICSGLAMLAVIFFPEWQEYILSLMYPQTKMIFIATAVVLICAGLLIMLTGRKKRKKERILSFKNDDGVIRISSAAISDYISKLATEFPSVVKMQPDVEPRGNMVDIIITLRVKAGPQIHEICEVMQRRVRETMVNGLGISDVRNVIVHVNEISPEHKSE